MLDLSPSNIIEEELLKKLKKRFEDGLFRSLEVEESNLIDFASNDYLGLSNQYSLKKNSQLRHLNSIVPPNFKTDNLRNNVKSGSTGSRLISGNFKEISDLEIKLAQFLKTESCLIFNSGYSANLSLFSTLPSRHDTIIFDEYIHASTRDGIRLSHAKSLSFKHNDIKDLERKFKVSNGNIFVAIESLYSMDGDFSDIQSFLEICDRYKAYLLVDEAHTSGISGKNGEGLVVELGLEKKILGRVHTFGKAFGSHGGAIVGSSILINYLINFSRQFIYTTAPSPEFVESLDKSLDRIIVSGLERKNLSLIEEYARNKFILNFESLTDNNHSHIKYILIKGNQRCKEIAYELQNSGIFVKSILSPTVPEGSERLRICLHSFNTTEEIDLLVAELKKFI